MTTLTRLWRRVERTTKNTHRLKIMMALLALIMASYLVLLVRRAPDAVLYSGERVLRIAPLETEVCIGGKVYFPTITEATSDEIPGRLEIDEAWCLAGPSGACKTVVAPNSRFPLLEPKRIVTPRVSRDVPRILTPGVYHFWHTATDTHGNVTGYIVAPITVLDCEVEK